MTHFFVENGVVGENRIEIAGGDFNHLKNVLRMREGEKVQVTADSGMVYTCEIGGFTASAALLDILSAEEGKTELKAEITLYQGLPKSDKLELIIQKAVELGAARIAPVLMHRSIVKPDPKKEENKRKRYQAISESAAKQSGRNRIPEVTRVMSFKEALEDAKENTDVLLIPYECADNMEETRAILSGIPKDARIGIFIGPEGGFERAEVEAVLSAGGKSITLGRRILRTETAGLMILSVLMFQLD